MGKLEVGERRDQEFQQRYDVLRLQGLEEPALSRSDERDAGVAQRALVDLEMRSPPHQDHEVAVVGGASLLTLQVDRNPPLAVNGLDFPDEQLRLVLAPAVFIVGEWPLQRIAQPISGSRLLHGVGLRQRQHFHAARLVAVVRGMLFESRERGLARKRAVHDIHHRRRTASRLVLRQLLRTKFFLEVPRGLRKQPCLGTTKAVDRLFRIMNTVGRMSAAAAASSQLFSVSHCSGLVSWNSSSRMWR